jgi:DNA-directed RNA polymerase specialized sigma24 family protein
VAVTKARASLKKDWVLSQDAFDMLLNRLDADRERAAERYEHIRRALILFFECRGSTSAEDHADTTINRAARRLLEGQDIRTENPVSYFYGIARNVLKETWDASAHTPARLDGAPLAARMAVDPHREWEQAAERRRRERRIECLERCLAELSADARQLIADYYQGETRTKIDNRRRLAERLAIPINALRIRALRLRERLERCVVACMERMPT